MIEFDRDGRHFKAGKGFVKVYKDGVLEFCFMDVFRTGEPTEELVYQLYKFWKIEAAR